MPRSKRNKEIHATRTRKVTREQKGKVIDEARTQASSNTHAWIVEVENSRGAYLQELRHLLKPNRLLMGRNKVMAIAMGNTPETEARPGLAAFGKHLEGERGLLFTSEPPATIYERLIAFSKPDYARSKNVATETVVLPAGIVYLADGDPAPHSMESQFRLHQVPTKLHNGKVTLESDFTVCKAGANLSADQANTLKLLKKKMAQFRIVPLYCLDMETGIEKAVDEGWTP